jgi:hypothetical protein
MKTEKGFYPSMSREKKKKPDNTEGICFGSPKEVPPISGGLVEVWG